MPFFSRIPLKEALELKRPLTRTVLESRIAEVQSILDGAVSRKAFTECPPLQSKLEGLISKRVDLPTMDELKAAVSLAEKDVADAAARRNFEAAASAQAALDNAKDRLDEAMRAEGMSSDAEARDESSCDDAMFQSRAELEAAIDGISAKIDEAIASKKFNVATKYQSELDELEKLRSTMPSLEELTAQLSELKAEMDKAIKTKNFQKADALQKDVDALEAKIADERCKAKEASSTPSSSNNNLNFINENGESITFDGRYRLEEEINRFKLLVSGAAASKKFKEASQFQDYLDRLEKMRPMLPNLEELTIELASKKTEMDLAIQNKDFKEAEHLHEVIESIEQKVLIEKKNTVTDTVEVSTYTPAPSVVVKAPTASVKNARPKALNDRTNTGASVYSKSSRVQISDSRPVSKLRPKAPMIAQEDNTVLAVAQLLASKRGDAAIITNSTGGLSGIVTDSEYDLVTINPCYRRNLN